MPQMMAMIDPVSQTSDTSNPLTFEPCRLGPRSGQGKCHVQIGSHVAEGADWTSFCQVKGLKIASKYLISK